MTPALADIIKTVLTLVLGPGSIAAIWAAARARAHTRPVAAHAAAEARVVRRSDVDEIAARWQAYADEIEERRRADAVHNRRALRAQADRIDRLEVERTEDRAANAALTIYAVQLRSHIDAELPPPPPPWPAGIDPA